jgi:hypothetical protein
MSFIRPLPQIKKTNMGILIDVLLCLFILAIFRYRYYQKQSALEELATEAEANVNEQIASLALRFKHLKCWAMIPVEDSTDIENRLHYLSEELVCVTGSLQNIEAYLSCAAQHLILISLKLDRLTQTCAAYGENSTPSSRDEHQSISTD